MKVELSQGPKGVGDVELDEMVDATKAERWLVWGCA